MDQRPSRKRWATSGLLALGGIAAAIALAAATTRDAVAPVVGAGALVASGAVLRPSWLVRGLLIAVPGVVGAVLAVEGYETAAAQLLAVAALLTVTLTLFALGPVRPMSLCAFTYWVSLRPFTYKVEGKEHQIASADLAVPEDARNDLDVTEGEDYEARRVGGANRPLPPEAEGSPHVREGHEYESQRGLYFRGLYVGDDGRWSTSKLQVLLWTYAVSFGLTALFLARALGDSAGLGALFTNEDQVEEYLVLLGGPFAAMVLAKYMTATKVEEGTVSKTESTPTDNPAQGLSEVVSEDSGRTDVVDFQYFLFNLLALAYFLVNFVSNFDDGFPDLPELLVALTGASAATYVGKKGLQREAASITAVLPTKLRAGGPLDIWGRSLVLQAPATSRKERPRVSVGAEEIPAAQVTILDDTSGGIDHIRTTVPRAVRAGTSRVEVVTAAGVTAQSAEREIESGVRILNVSPGRIVRGESPQLIVLGQGFADNTELSSVELDKVPLAIREWTDTRIDAALDVRNAYQENRQAKLEVKDEYGQRSNAYEVVVT